MAVSRSYFALILVLVVLLQVASSAHLGNGTGKTSSRLRSKTSARKASATSSRLRSAAPVAAAARSTSINSGEDEFEKLMIESNDFDDLFNEIDVMGSSARRPSAVLPSLDIDDPLAAEYEDLLFDEYDSLPMSPVVETNFTSNSDSTTSKYLTSEV